MISARLAPRDADLLLAHAVEALAVADRHAQARRSRRRRRRRPVRQSSSDRRRAAARRIGRGEPHRAAALRLHQARHGEVAVVGRQVRHVRRVQPAEDLDVRARAATNCSCGRRCRHVRCRSAAARLLGREHEPHQQVVVQVRADLRRIQHHRRCQAGADDRPGRCPTASGAWATAGRRAQTMTSRPAAKRRSCPRPSTTTPRHWPPAMSSLVTVACVSSVRLGACQRRQQVGVRRRDAAHVGVTLMSCWPVASPRLATLLTSRCSALAERHRRRDERAA